MPTVAHKVTDPYRRPSKSFKYPLMLAAYPKYFKLEVDKTLEIIFGRERVNNRNIAHVYHVLYLSQSSTYRDR